MLIKALILLFSYELLIILHAKIDAKEAEHEWVKHSKESIIIFSIVLGLTILLTFLMFHSWKYVIAGCLIFLPQHWITFDLVLNYFRKKPLSYEGTIVKGKSALTDILLNLFPNWMQYLIKVLFLLLVIGIDYLILR